MLHTYFDPVNIAVNDTDETVVEIIVQHDFSNTDLDPFLPKPISLFSASVQNIYRRITTGQFTCPPLTPAATSTTRQTTDVNVADLRRCNTFVVSKLKIHKALPLNGTDVKVFTHFLSRYVHISDNDPKRDKIDNSYVTTPQKW